MEDVKAQSFDFMLKTDLQHTTDVLVHDCGEESTSCFPTILAAYFLHARIDYARSKCRPCQ